MIPACNLRSSMATNSSAEPQGEPKPTVQGHENTDVRVRAIFVFVILLFVCLVAIQWILGGMLKGLKKGAPPMDAWSQPPRAARPAETPPPRFPRLQLSPLADLEAFRAREEAELHSYGWIDRTSGIVRIPIERAIELTLQRGLPLRTRTNENKAGKSSLEMQQQRALRAQPLEGAK